MSHLLNSLVKVTRPQYWTQWVWVTLDASYDRAAGNMFHWALHANFTHRSHSAANPPSAQHMCVGFEGVLTWLKSNNYNKSNKSEAEDADVCVIMQHY